MLQTVPHTMPVGRPDEVKAASQLVLQDPTPEAQRRVLSDAAPLTA
jgi:hypothetical protein